MAPRFTMGTTETPGLVSLQVEHVQSRSKDGTMVPLAIISRQGLTKVRRRPTLLIGYGAYRRLHSQDEPTG